MTGRYATGQVHHMWLWVNWRSRTSCVAGRQCGTIPTFQSCLSWKSSTAHPRTEKKDWGVWPVTRPIWGVGEPRPFSGSSLGDTVWHVPMTSHIGQAGRDVGEILHVERYGVQSFMKVLCIMINSAKFPRDSWGIFCTCPQQAVLYSWIVVYMYTVQLNCSSMAE